MCVYSIDSFLPAFTGAWKVAGVLSPTFLFDSSICLTVLAFLRNKVSVSIFQWATPAIIMNSRMMKKKKKRLILQIFFSLTFSKPIYFLPPPMQINFGYSPTKKKIYICRIICKFWSACTKFAFHHENFPFLEIKLPFLSIIF